MLDYIVLYTSETGNTKQLATEIFAALPGSSKDIMNIDDFYFQKEATTYLIGFWTNRGTCPLNIMDFLADSHGKRIMLFGTCGMGYDTSYFEAIASQVSVFIPEDNTYLGCFLCQGKMPISVRQKYESMLTPGVLNEKIERMICNFDHALLHPNTKDFQKAKEYILTHLET